MEQFGYEDFVESCEADDLVPFEQKIWQHFKRKLCPPTRKDSLPKMNKCPLKWDDFKKIRIVFQASFWLLALGRVVRNSVNSVAFWLLVFASKVFSSRWPGLDTSVRFLPARHWLVMLKTAHLEQSEPWIWFISVLQTSTLYKSSRFLDIRMIFKYFEQIHYGSPEWCSLLCFKVLWAHGVTVIVRGRRTWSKRALKEIWCFDRNLTPIGLNKSCVCVCVSKVCCMLFAVFFWMDLYWLLLTPLPLLPMLCFWWGWKNHPL